MNFIIKADINEFELIINSLKFYLKEKKEEITKKERDKLLTLIIKIGGVIEDYNFAYVKNSI